MENKVTIFGASGHGKVIIDVLNSNSIIVNAIVDDAPKFEHFVEIKIINSKDYNFLKNENVIIAIGNNKVRKIISKRLEVIFVKAIHFNSIISQHSFVDVGTVVMAGVCINFDTKIGKHCIINTGAIVEHDCIINDFVHISPGASIAGNVEVGEGTHIGIGATIIQGIKIGKWVTIGAGSVIIRDIPDFAVVVGNPGKIIKFNSYE